MRVIHHILKYYKTVRLNPFIFNWDQVGHSKGRSQVCIMSSKCYNLHLVLDLVNRLKFLCTQMTLLEAVHMQKLKTSYFGLCQCSLTPEIFSQSTCLLL